ncbi:hypothetical protein [Neobacillus vireti]|uniref:hypothetical protein n=1 Tax=Neobacillus vireti TaxID=220686 RepID=UPI003000D370
MNKEIYALMSHLKEIVQSGVFSVHPSVLRKLGYTPAFILHKLKQIKVLGLVVLVQPKNKSNNTKDYGDKKSIKILELEKEVALGLWIQVIGQIIEIKGLSGLLHIEEDANTIGEQQILTGEQQILTGVWIKTIGQILEAISVSSQIGETDLIKLLQEQKLAITGDMLVTIGSAYEVIGGIHVLEEETDKIPRIVP